MSAALVVTTPAQPPHTAASRRRRRCQRAPRRPAGRLPAAAAAAASQQGHSSSHQHKRAVGADGDGTTSLAALAAWVGAAAGGWVDPRLVLSECAPQSGCRGVTASAPISQQDLADRGPLICVPQALQFTASTAAGIIAAAAGEQAAHAAADALSGSQLIAAALAHELRTLQQQQQQQQQQPGTGGSFWAPYLATLPQQPPNPWLLQDARQVSAAVEAALASSAARQQQQQQQQQQRAKNMLAEWTAAVAAARVQQEQAAAAVEQLLGRALGITQSDVLLALGHVASRSLAGGSSGAEGSSGGLCPVIDLINHHASAAAPMLQLDDDDRLVMTVLPVQEGEAVALEAGAELLIQYRGGYSALEAFLKFGFVADEWWSD